MIEEESYYMEEKVKDWIDKRIIPDLNKRDKDKVVLVDGSEGGGKSSLALQIGKRVDPTLDLSRVVFDGESFKEAVINAKKGQVIVFDEAFTGLSSRSALSKMNKGLVSLMMEMRQKNLFVIIVLPSFFLLDKYVAIFRSSVLFHIYTGKEGKRGYYKVFSRRQKKLIYLMGKKNYSYGAVRGAFRGRFYGKYPLDDEKAYRIKKALAFRKYGEEDTKEDNRYMKDRKIALANWYLDLKKHEKISQDKFCSMLKPLGISMSRSNISKIVSDIRELGKIRESEASKVYIKGAKSEKKLKSKERERKKQPNILGTANK